MQSGSRKELRLGVITLWNANSGPKYYGYERLQANQFSKICKDALLQWNVNLERKIINSGYTKIFYIYYYCITIRKRLVSKNRYVASVKKFVKRQYYRASGALHKFFINLLPPLSQPWFRVCWGRYFWKKKKRFPMKDTVFYGLNQIKKGSHFAFIIIKKITLKKRLYIFRISRMMVLGNKNSRMNYMMWSKGNRKPCKILHFCEGIRNSKWRHIKGSYKRLILAKIIFRKKKIFKRRIVHKLIKNNKRLMYVWLKRQGYIKLKHRRKKYCYSYRKNRKRRKRLALKRMKCIKRGTLNIILSIILKRWIYTGVVIVHSISIQRVLKNFYGYKFLKTYRNFTKFYFKRAHWIVDIFVCALYRMAFNKVDYIGGVRAVILQSTAKHKRVLMNFMTVVHILNKTYGWTVEGWRYAVVGPIGKHGRTKRYKYYWGYCKRYSFLESVDSGVWFANTFYGTLGLRIWRQWRKYDTSINWMEELGLNKKVRS
jgi:hypothetical protein